MMKPRTFSEFVKGTSWFKTTVVLIFFFLMDYTFRSDYSGVKPVCESVLFAAISGGIVAFLRHKVPENWNGTSKIESLKIDAKTITYAQIFLKIIQDISIWMLVWTIVYTILFCLSAFIVTEPVKFLKLLSDICFYSIVIFIIDFAVVLKQVFAVRRKKH